MPPCSCRQGVSGFEGSTRWRSWAVKVDGSDQPKVQCFTPLQKSENVGARQACRAPTLSGLAVGARERAFEAMKSRCLYLVAWDISCPRRLARVGRAAAAHRVEGQKSMVECWMTTAERRKLMASLRSIIDLGQDRLHLYRLDPRQTPILFGTASHFTQDAWIIS